MKKNILALILFVAAGMSVSAAEVRENWDKHCASCHGKDGKGQTKMGQKAGAKDYTDAKVQAELKDDQAFKSIKEGITEKGKEKMKPFGDKLTDDEIKALVAYVRTFKK
jgi:mono/diheme cytochrome c family protein